MNLGQSFLALPFGNERFFVDRYTRLPMAISGSSLHRLFALSVWKLLAHLYGLPEAFKTWQLANMVHTSKQAETLQSANRQWTKEKRGKVGPRWQKTPAHCLQQ